MKVILLFIVIFRSFFAFCNEMIYRSASENCEVDIQFVVYLDHQPCDLSPCLLLSFNEIFMFGRNLRTSLFYLSKVCSLNIYTRT